MRVRTLFFLAALAASACATSHAVPRPYPGAPAPPSADAGRVPTEREPPAALTTSPPFVMAVVEVAEGLLGAPYRSGGADPTGFDCSGFVQFVFGRAGVALPRNVREQWGVGMAVEAGDLRPGDLVFFAIGGREVSHVGIMLDAERFVHAPSARGSVRVERLAAAYWAKRYVGARRIEGSR